MNPELLLPAGSVEKMHTAFDFGADAVYAGQPRYSLRARNNAFSTVDMLQRGIEGAHARGRQFFVASNLFAHNAKVNTYLADMEPVIALKPDALIMADPGLIMLVRERWPEMPIHLSVQANAVNWADVQFWQRIGLTRVILSRELSLDEIAEIRQRCPDMELEVFVHGAMCIAYSGRCLLSGYFNQRDPNQGTCTNACRWDYKVVEGHEDATGDVRPLTRLAFDAQAAMGEVDEGFGGISQGPRHPLADQTYLIEDRTRPGQYMPIEEDAHGTYILNAKDLRAVAHIARLIAIGVNSFKIEGRTKSRYYVARTAQVYRCAIDDAVAGRPFRHPLLAELDGLANRGYTDGFYQRHRTQEQQNYEQGSSTSQRSQYVGDVLNIAEGWAQIEVKNQFEVGDRLEVIHPAGNQEITITAMRDIENAPIQRAAGAGRRVHIPLAASYRDALLAKLF